MSIFLFSIAGLSKVWTKKAHLFHMISFILLMIYLEDFNCYPSVGRDHLSLTPPGVINKNITRQKLPPV